MTASCRQATLRLLTALALGTLVLTGCGGTAEGRAAAPSPVEASTTAPADRVPFAGTKQFVTIDRAWAEGGLTKLSVRLAEKKVNTQFDTWEIIPGTGARSTVTLAKDARVLLTVPVRGEDAAGVRGSEPVPTPQAEFVTLLTRLEPRTRRSAGFDLSFDGEGRVVKLQSLYRP